MGWKCAATEEGSGVRERSVEYVVECGGWWGGECSLRWVTCGVERVWCRRR